MSQISARAYTLDELDRMRTVIRRAECRPPRGGFSGPSDQALHYWSLEVEDLLRTYMMAGIGATELEDKWKDHVEYYGMGLVHKSVVEAAAKRTAPPTTQEGF